MPLHVVTVDAPVGAAVESVVDEVVDALAHEPGTRKGPVLWLALLFLLTVIAAGLWWAFKDDGRAQRDAPLVGFPVPATEHDVQRAPTLAEQMGGANASSADEAVSTMPRRQAAVPPMPVTRTAAPKPARPPVPDRKSEQEQVRQVETARTDQTVASGAREESGQPAADAAALSTAQQVAVCEKMSIFARQPCLWRACNHKWGRDGCPSYD